MIDINIFLGYQIKSVFHKTSDFKELIKLLSNQLLSKKPAINLDAKVGEFPPGTQLWEEISIAIQSADIAIFDISENNPNVLLEVGIAVGNGKHVILLKCESSKDKFPLPVDLHSFIYLPYINSATLSSSRFLKALSNAILHFVKNKHNLKFYYHALWALKPESKSILIPGRLPEELTGNKFEDYIRLRRLSDLDSVLLIFETLHKLYPLMEISIKDAKTLSDLPKNWEEYNLILIGGPDFNPLVKEFEDKCPFEYCYGKDENDIWLKHKKTKKEYRTKFTGVGEKQKAMDFGFFLKYKMPSNSKLVMLGGARTWGVCGAAMLLSCTSSNKNHGYQTARKLVERFGTDPSLVIPIEVSGSKDNIHPPKWKENLVERI